MAGKRNAFRDPELPDFGAVYEEYFDFVWRTLRRYGVPEAAMDDAIQDAFLVVHSRLPTFEGRSSLRTWIFGIARRVARDHRLWEAFILVKLEQMTLLEAGEALDVNANTIYSRVRTACRELEEALARLYLHRGGP